MDIKKLQEIVNVLKDGLLSIYLYNNRGGKKIPVFILKNIDLVFLDSIRHFFVRKQFIILTKGDIQEGADVFCLKLLHIKNHSELFYGKHILGEQIFKLSDLRSSLELDIRNKLIQLREDYLSQDKRKYFLDDLLFGMQIIWEGCLRLKNPNLIVPENIKELLSLFDVAWSCNSQKFYYLIDGKMEERQVPSFIHDVHTYLVEICTKINNFTL